MLSLLLAAGLAASDVPLDFTPQARLLFRVVACGDDSPLPAHLDARVVAKHCQEMERRKGLYRATWVKKAMPFLQELQPKGLPNTVVYPFGGGDLLSALTTYPGATDITTLSLEHAGDPRRIEAVSARQLDASLKLLRATSAGLLVANDSRTENLMKGQRGELPGQLSFFLIGLAVHGYEPVRVRYFTLGADGSVQYLTEERLAASEREQARLLHKAWVSPDFSAAFDNVEIQFRKAGDATAPLKVHRHLPANLSDASFGKDAAMRAYLEGKGRIVAMTKAASYLLWRDHFSTIRDYLLGHMDFMVSDSTGIPPPLAKAAGFTQVPYGRFNESFLNANPAYNAAFRELWKDAPPLQFRYGYLDRGLSKHLLVTRKP